MHLQIQITNTMICIFNREEFIYRTFEDCIAAFISESLLGNTPVNVNSPKVAGYLFVFYLYLVLMFAVSHVNLLHIRISTYPKNDY